MTGTPEGTPRHTAEASGTARRSPWRSPVLWAGLAVVAAAALVVAPGTLAYLNDSASAPTATITAAPGITATATAKVESLVLGQIPPGMYSTGSTGIIPGLRAQRFTFVVGSGAKDAVQSTISGSLSLTNKAALGLWTEKKLILTATTSSACAIDGTHREGESLVATISSAPNTTLRPGATCTITVDMGIPGSLAGRDVTQDPAVRAVRGQSLGVMNLEATLSQVPRSEER